jgi:3D (Asp-Asp-Asp) domain-containing protein
VIGWAGLLFTRARSIGWAGLLFTRARSCYAVAGVVALVAAGCVGRVHPQGPTTALSRTATGSSPFTATAYCKGTITATGTKPNARSIAADPRVLPMGTRIRLTGVEDRYSGVYTVKDTGPSIRGRRLDLYIRDCREAVKFGRRSVRVSVLR